MNNQASTFHPLGNFSNDTQQSSRWVKLGLSFIKQDFKKFKIRQKLIFFNYLYLCKDQFKALRKQNLCNNITSLELVSNMLAEVLITEISKKRKPRGLSENKQVAKEGGILQNKRE